MVCPYLKNKGSAVRFCLWPLMQILTDLFDISKIKRISFREDINGLRAIAVLSVVFYHADIGVFKGGWLGVDIFFVISGYLISNIIVSELNEGTFTFKNFYLRRIRRILPALFSTLIVTIAFSYLLLTPKAMQEFINSIISSLFFFANYHFMNLDFYIAESTKVMPLLHTWSLAIEEQYYLLFPLFAYLIFKYLKKYFLFIVVLITTISVYINTATQSLEKFYRLEYRVWELLLGAVVMILSNNFKIKNLEKIGLPLLVFPLLVFDHYSINDIEPKLLALTGVSLIIFSNTKHTFLTKILNFKALSVIGLSSYSIYLIHQPLFAFVRLSYSGRLLTFSDNEKYILIGLSIIFGYFSFIFVEQKNLRNTSYIFLLLSFIFIILFSIIGISDSGYSSRFNDTTSYLQKYYLPQQRDGIDEELCIKNSSEYEYFCNLNYDQKNENLVIIGDSHLTTISAELIENNNLENFNIFLFLRQGCPFILSLKNNETRANCGSDLISNEFKSITESNKTTTIFGGRFPWYFNGDAFETNYGTIGDDTRFGGKDFLIGLEENINFLVENSSKLILIDPIPELGYFPLEPYLYKQYDIKDEITYDVEYWNQYSVEVNNLLDDQTNSKIFRVKPKKIFCDNFFANRCTSSFEGIFFYYDDDHLTRDGARLVVDEVLTHIDMKSE